MSDKTKTAVEWIVRKLSTELIGEIPMHRWDEIRDAVQEAKRMEKEQIIEAHITGDKAYTVGGLYHVAAEKYYNDKYGK